MFSHEFSNIPTRHRLKSTHISIGNLTTNRKLQWWSTVSFSFFAVKKSLHPQRGEQKKPKMHTCMRLLVDNCFCFTWDRMYNWDVIMQHHTRYHVQGNYCNMYSWKSGEMQAHVQNYSFILMVRHLVNANAKMERKTGAISTSRKNAAANISMWKDTTLSIGRFPPNCPAVFKLIAFRPFF